MFFIMNENELLLFKEYVGDWIKKENEIKEYQTKIKVLQDAKKKLLSPKIIDFMNKNKIEELNTDSSGKISLSKTKTRSGITKKKIKEKLYEELDPVKAEKIFKELYDSRTTTETTILKRT